MIELSAIEGLCIFLGRYHGRSLAFAYPGTRVACTAAAVSTAHIVPRYTTSRGTSARHSCQTQEN